MRVRAVLFDLDGTLVDSNEFHVEAWDAAFREAGFILDRAAIHDQIGKGGDMLVPALLPDLDAEAQEALAGAHGRIFQGRYLARVAPFPGARALLERVHQSGRDVVFASSAAQAELDHYIALLDAAPLLMATTSADDVAASKPAPDIFAAALRRLSPLDADQALVIGDTPYDIIAAGKCGIAAIGVRSGGFADAVLQEAGAIALYDDVAALRAGFDASPLAG